MSDLLNIGKSGVMAYRSALSAVGDNVVNAETKGYARRSIVLQESPVSAGTNPYLRANTTFGGVQVNGVARVWDDFKAADTRLTAGDAGRADARLRWLSNAEGSLDDGDYGIGTRLTAVFTAGDALASDPQGGAQRRAMLLAIDDAAGTIRSTADALARTADGISTEAQNSVDSVNGSLAALAKVNLGMRRVGAGTSAHAQLEDERDRLIDDIASKIGIDVSLDGDGVATLKLAGATGATLLDGATAGFLGLERAGDGRLALIMSGTGPATMINAANGSLAGLVEVAATVADRRTQLDTMAANFATALNTWNAQGLDAAGQPGGNLLTITGGAATLTLAVTDADKIAAASTDGTANGNLLTLPALRGASGAEQQWAAMVSSQAQLVAAAKAENSAASARNDGAFAARDDVSGIDLDRAAADLVRYQQAYSASARIIQTARETFQSILDIF